MNKSLLGLLAGLALQSCVSHNPLRYGYFVDEKFPLLDEIATEHVNHLIAEGFVVNPEKYGFYGLQGFVYDLDDDKEYSSPREFVSCIDFFVYKKAKFMLDDPLASCVYFGYLDNSVKSGLEILEAPEGSFEQEKNILHSLEDGLDIQFSYSIKKTWYVSGFSIDSNKRNTKKEASLQRYTK